MPKTEMEQWAVRHREEWAGLTPFQAFRMFWKEKRYWPDWGFSWKAAMQVIDEMIAEGELHEVDVKVAMADYRTTIDELKNKIERITEKNFELSEQLKKNKEVASKSVPSFLKKPSEKKSTKKK